MNRIRVLKPLTLPTALLDTRVIRLTGVNRSHKVEPAAVKRETWFFQERRDSTFLLLRRVREAPLHEMRNRQRGKPAERVAIDSESRDPTRQLRRHRFLASSLGEEFRCLVSKYRDRCS